MTKKHAVSVGIISFILCVTSAVVTYSLFRKPNVEKTSFIRSYPPCVEYVETLPIRKIATSVGESITSFGSTFYIGNGKWITAAHVIPHSAEPSIFLSDAEIIFPDILYRDDEHDIVILYHSTYRSAIQFSYSLEEPELDSTVWNLGFAGWVDRKLLSTTGSVIGNSENNMMYTSSAVLSGMSGGPSIQCYGDTPVVTGVISLFSRTKLGEGKNDRGKTEYINDGNSFISPLKNIEAFL